MDEKENVPRLQTDSQIPLNLTDPDLYILRVSHRQGNQSNKRSPKQQAKTCRLVCLLRCVVPRAPRFTDEQLNGDINSSSHSHTHTHSQTGQVKGDDLPLVVFIHGASQW